MRCAALLVLGCFACVLGAGGCASSSASPEFEVASGRYGAAFDATREVLRDHRFQLERVDLQQGVVTTQPKNTAGLASPWDKEQSTLGQEVDDFINHQRRVVRVRFENIAGAEGSIDPAAPVRGRVEVTVYRIQSPGLRPATRAIGMSTVAVDPQATAQGVGSGYETPVAQDTRLAARLAEEISRRTLKAR